MAIESEPSTLTVALVGNPNTGKSTLFGVLAGVHQHVGNYPGVTVEKKTGRMDLDGRRYELVDLPGLYSLAPRSRDEMVAVDLLLGRREDRGPVDAVVCIVDAGKLERSFYLLSQVLELGLPTVLAVNMLDVAQRHGVQLDLERLARQLPVPVVPIQANRQIGIAELKTALAEAIARGPAPPESPFPEAFQREVTRLESLVSGRATAGDGQKPLPRCLLGRLLLDVNGYLEGTLLGSTADPNGVDPNRVDPNRADEDSGDSLGSRLAAARERLAAADCAVPTIETTARYGWARRVLQGVVTEPSRYWFTSTDRIDRVLTHRVAGTVIFALLMLIVFQAVFVLGRAGETLIVQAIGSIGVWVEATMAEGAPRSLVVDGIISGVGGVLRFLPQILILFFFIAVLEGCGYMARAAYLMDKVMVRVGLSGRSFIPMLSCFACAVPGIMATRVIENPRDRLTTILVAPLMTCSARLPIYAVLIGVFIPPRSYLGGLVGLQGLTMAGLYALGIAMAVTTALVLKRTILRGGALPLLMELPSYQWPTPRVVLFRVVQRAWLFVRCAGTIILVVSILVWAALYYPHNAEVVEAPFRAERSRLQTELARLGSEKPRHEEVAMELARIEREINGAYQRRSLLGQTGRAIEPVVRPLGWDWRIGTAVIASLPAREIVVATLAVIYNAGDDLEQESAEARFQSRLHEATWDGSDPPRKVFNLPVALSIMVFFALCAQCAATLAVMRRETNSWRWPAFAFTYMTALAYLGAFVTYRVGMWIGS